MSESEGALRREKGQIQGLALTVFAVVGFLSSIVTIVSWFSSTQASLSAIVTPTTIEIPTDMRLAGMGSDDYNITTAISDLKDRYCNPVVSDYSGNKEKNFLYSAERCRNSSSIFSSMQKIIDLDGKKLVVWDALLSNDGRNVAENIKIRSTVPVSVTGKDVDGNQVQINAEAGQKVFALPNMNPGDKIQLRLISSTPLPGETEPAVGRPKFTYSGGIASNRELIRVSGRYSDIVSFLDGLPTFFQIAVIIGVSLIITLVWMVPLGMLIDASEKRKKAQLAAGVSVE